LAEYLLDTDHLSYAQEGHPRVVDRLRSLASSDRVFTSVVNVAELLRGVHLLPAGRRKRELFQLYSQVIGPAGQILPITLPVAERFAATDAALRRKGRPIPVNDVWIAALALVRGAVPLTNDDHFRHVDDLVTENWTR
jgi:tRNA(fMet)-specific endonuclease VapC